MTRRCGGKRGEPGKVPTVCPCRVDGGSCVWTPSGDGEYVCVECDRYADDVILGQLCVGCPDCKPCERCEGAGYLGADEAWDVCPACKGTGVEP